jgi:tRNA(Ile)-lysidine synthase
MSQLRPPDALLDRFRGDLDALAGPGGGPLGVAVSGGPDSLALLLLAKAARPGQIRAATVDHGLRPESADEARHVATICAELGCPHDTLKVRVAPGGEGAQGQARRARYDALERWAAAAGLAGLLTAHHADDQAETLLMRLQRGSGAAGLAGVRANLDFAAPGGTVRLYRPLLAWRRETLAGLVRDCGLAAVDDPSNRDPAFDRVRMRRRLAETPWLDVAAIARSAAALAEADDALDAWTRSLLAERVEAAGGAIALRPDGLPDEIVRRLVLTCLRRVAPGAAPRGDQVGALIARLRGGGAATLAGVRCEGKGAIFRFRAAPPRRSG